MKRWFPLTGLLLAIFILSYLESPDSILNRKHVHVVTIPNEVLLANEQEGNHAEPTGAEAEETASTGGDEIAPLNFSLETVLEKRSKDGHYIMETYREYEYYRDEDGRVIKKVPTENTHTLRYYKP